MFYVEISTHRGRKHPELTLSLEVGQGSHDVNILTALVRFFNAGYVSPKCDFTNLEEVVGIRSKSIFKLKNPVVVMEFFEKYHLLTDKLLNYEDFKSIFNMKQQKTHHTLDGLAEIQKIKANINRNRTKKIKIEIGKIS